MIKENELPDGWKNVKLEKLCFVKGGKRIPKGDTFSHTKTSRAYLRVTDMIKKSINTSSLKYISEEVYNKIQKYIISKDDVYITIAGTIGLSGTIPPELDGTSLTENAAKLVIKDDKVLDKTYLAYILDSVSCQLQIKQRTNAVGVPKLAIFRIETIEIPVPPLPIQKKIVAILEKTEKLREWRKEADALTDDFLKSVFQDMFGEKNKFDEAKLGEVTKIISGSTPSTSKEEYWGGDIDWIAPAELIDGDNYYYFETKKKITKKGLKSCSSTLFPKETVMLTTRAPIGKVAIAGKDMCSNQGFKNLIPSDRINPIYLYFWLLLKKRYLNSLGRGVTFKEISKTIVSNIEIPLPPISLQNKFASIVEKVEDMRNSQKQSRQEIDNLFNALMQKAFKGELVG
ncbi:MAG: hypothetical protein DRN71_00640 [Candidatus Nanohalarchaeota archaeon]|nr:MAG: hypothetical protein DRN71_00640 [Candidatus Nanohaloarchaeota archaeon]